ncbi:MAG: fumarylacetoacetate hydrolase family protein [Verrucomicrobia bacterium]|nr:fumarylacetoacetate hydrolase family protein [Verrucomicrobiota bacterium]
MRLCRFQNSRNEVRIGLVRDDQTILDLTALGIERLSALLESEEPVRLLEDLVSKNPPSCRCAEVRLLTPVERQEVWAAGVTYLRSKKARMEESDFSASAYDRVYEADRPELFFKSLPEKVVASNEPVGIRKDARWNVPEPELVLVINSHGRIAGYSIGNDMSSRDIEGENTLYLPQAKVYHRSCAVGPVIRLGAAETEARTWKIELRVRRGGVIAFAGETSVGQIKRSLTELADYLFRSQVFPHGAVLLTGTGIVPPDDFSLQVGDEVAIHISGIGDLTNRVVQV